MNAASLIRHAKSEGVHLFLTPTGSVRLIAPSSKVGRVWLERLRDWKPQIISELAENEPQKDKRRIWRVTVDGKTFTMIDPEGEPMEVIRKRLVGKFGGIEKLEPYSYQKEGQT